MNIISGLNEFANLFQWVTSAISSLKSQSSETQGDINQLHSDIECLTDTLPAIYNLINRAEWKIHDDSVANLLSRLKDAVHDAEDLLDEFRWYNKKASIEGSLISLDPVIGFFHSVTQDSFNKVTAIQKRLNQLSGKLEEMGLLQAVPRFEKSFRPETTSLPTEAKILGRNKEKAELIRLLGVPTNNIVGPSGRKRKRNEVCSAESNQICGIIDSNEATLTSVPVLPIFGIGGVGKTTLAQEICNNPEVKNHFDPIIWICVSDDFDVKRLTKEAIEQSCGKVPKNDNLNFLQGALANSLNNRRFLLVLDDIWNDKQQEWKCFYAPFRNVLQGSMMLVTTRSLKVADVVRTMDPFPLLGLDKNVFRKFFKLCVFGSHISNKYPELEQIGEKILPRLKGSPLAAKTIGRLLGMRLDQAHWNGILNSQLWEHGQEETDILPALRLSYMYLPFYLKRCFSFCAVYPKDYNFRKKDLAEIWVAEDFIEPQHTGDQYFEELVHLSFFQKYPRSKDKYVIHDLMHDMAQLVSKDECFIVKDTKDLPKIPQNVRHLSVLKGGDVKCDDLLNLSKYKKLRTLLCDLPLNSKTGNTVMEKWCDQLLCMRVMVCPSISKWGFPESIGNMKLLRYLEILNSSPCKELPSGFCCLYNLQIFYAMKWEIDDIPSGFGMLSNLQKFESVKCQFHLKGATDEGQRNQFKLKNYNGGSLPSWFHAQNSEQIHIYDSNDSPLLSLADVKITDCSNLSDLKQFLQPAYVSSIKNIEISKCRSLKWVPADRFGHFHFLEVLSVSHCPEIKSRHLFAPSLKKLYLEDSGNLGYKIECSSLTILHLSNCPLESIELQMSNSPSPQELKISSCPYLTSIVRDSEPINSGVLQGEARNRAIDNTLLSRTDVEITECGNLKWVPTDMFGIFHFLKVSDCPMIESEEGQFAPSLRELYLKNSGNIGYEIKCSSLTILHLSQYPLESIDLQMWSLPSLQELEISDCLYLTVIGDSEPRAIRNTFWSLTDVKITRCKKLSSLEQFLQQAYVPNIKKIVISYCMSLRSLPSFGDLHLLKVLHVKSCTIESQSLCVPSLTELFLATCGNLGGNIECSSLTNLRLLSSSLEAVELRNLPLLKLEISHCKQLKSIGGPDAIAQIRDLRIEYCRELTEIEQPLKRGSFL